jgi:hypothetical protein
MPLAQTGEVYENTVVGVVTGSIVIEVELFPATIHPEAATEYVTE